MMQRRFLSPPPLEYNDLSFLAGSGLCRAWPVQIDRTRCVFVGSVQHFRVAYGVGA